MRSTLLSYGLCGLLPVVESLRRFIYIMYKYCIIIISVIFLSSCSFAGNDIITSSAPIENDLLKIADEKPSNAQTKVLFPNENEELICKIDGISYYRAKIGGSELGALRDISGPNEYDTEGSIRELIERKLKENGYPYTIDDTELALAAKDWEKAQKMMRDIDDILETFTAIMSH